MTSEKTEKRWFVVELAVGPEFTERAAACLWEFPITGIEEDPEGRLIAFSETPWDGASLERALSADGVETAHPPRTHILEDQDWLALWKQSWRPTPLGERLLVIPAWWDRPLDAGRIPVRIDPGRAFGTGTHESTALAWELLEAFLVREPATTGWMVDVGTGTGVLSLGALALAPGLRAVATEADPQAVASLRPNLVLNPSARLHAVGCRSVPLRSGSIVLAVANLTAAEHDAVDSELRPVLGDFAHLILSGLLADQLPSLAARWMAREFTERHRASRGIWCAIHLAGSASSRSDR